MIGKWLLALMMMAGRLEIFTVLLLFVPAFWRGVFSGAFGCFVFGVRQV
jgi:Trk-type K+ transport system membrane component